MPNSGLLNDNCGVCDGDNSSCIDSCGIPNGNNTTCADLNNDNTVNVTDVVLLVNLILTQSSNSLGDVNNDNNVNVTDVVMLINIILEIVNEIIFLCIALSLNFGETMDNKIIETESGLKYKILQKR